MTKTFRDQRLTRGWTLRDLADRCVEKGLTRPSDSNLSLIERGGSSPRPPLRAALAELLDLPITYFDEHRAEAMVNDKDKIRDLIDESSLGTPGARKLRARTDAATLRKIKDRIAAGEAPAEDERGQAIDRDEELRTQ